MNELPLACQRYMELLEQGLGCDASSAEELAEARAHAAQCSDCAALAGALRLMATPAPPSAAQHQAFKEAALRGEIIERHRRRHRRVALALAAAFAGLALGAVLWRATLPGAWPSASPTFAFAQPYCGKVELLVGEGVESCGESAPLRLPDGSRIRLHPHSRVVLVSNGRPERRLRLERGRLSLQLAPLAGRRFIVETAYCEARVVGTTFEVSVARGDAEVAVVEGTVEVAAQALREPKRLIGGWGLRLSEGRKRKLAPGREAKILAALAVVPRPTDAPRPPSPVEAGLPATKTPPRPPRAPVIPPLKGLLREARRCRGAGDLRCARANYLALQRHHGTTPVAITALVALAELELRQPPATLKHSRRYLGLRPQGALIREAAHLELRAFRALGKRGAERGAIERFLQRFPSSIYAPALQIRLDALRR